MVTRCGGGRRIKGKFEEAIRSTLFVLVLTLAVFSSALAAYASTMPLHDKPPGTVITFSGQQWIILNQETNGETYIIHDSNIGARAFDPDRTNLFNPSDSDNIAYYLNNTYYDSLSQKELIADHAWDRVSVNSVGRNGTNMGSVTCKIGLISYREYEAYSLYYGGNILPVDFSNHCWTRTPYDSISSRIWIIDGVVDDTPKGSIGYCSFTNFAYINVRPTLYLQSGTLVSDTNEVIGKAVLPSAPIGLNAQAIAPGSVDLAWQANTEEDLAGYIVYRDGVEVTRVVNMTSYTDYGVDTNATYTYTVAAYNAQDLTSPQSDPVTVTTLPSKPQVEVTAEGLDLHATWSGEAETFRVLVNGQEVGDTAEHSFDYTLPEYDSYIVQVVGTNVSGEVASDPISLDVFPHLVKPVVTASVDNRTVELTWTGNADSYRVIVNGKTIQETAEKLYTWTAPDAGDYVVQIVAVRGTEELASDSLTVSISSFTTPGAGQMAGDLLNNCGAFVAPMGGLIALALALGKGTPLIVEVLKRWML